MGRFARPEAIAAGVAPLASDDASYMTGSILALDGGATAHTGQPDRPRIPGPDPVSRIPPPVSNE